MATQTEGEDRPLEPSTEFDNIPDVRNVPEIDRSKWMAITNMIHYQGRKAGYKEGFEHGVQSYTVAWRFWWNSGTFLTGGMLGMTIGSFLLLLLFKASGVLIIGG